MRVLTLFTCLLFFLSFFPAKIFAQDYAKQPGQVVIINQVRGNECCDKGNIDFFKKQVNTLDRLQLPASFVIRYDALTDSQYQEVLRSLETEQYELGILLEITPDLARDAGVEYLGNEVNWYQAQHAYSVGYSLDESKKLMDTLINQFEKTIGYTPTISTGWITDTPTINYLREHYGIEVHQITREQWGTDSYTLYGGPPHYPYIGSENWSFIPASTSSGTLMLRQTGADPLYNYGDQSNAFTTQPNDYTLDGKDFSYFQTLFDNFMDQPGQPYGFVLLGLENSMPEEIQDEYIRQLEYVAQKNSSSSAVIQILTPREFNDMYRDQWHRNMVMVVRRSDNLKDNQVRAYWIRTSKYRLRLLFKENKVSITDLRLYDQELEDPYTYSQAQNLAYWVAPFIFDSSRFYQLQANKTIFTSMQQWIRSKLFPDYKYVSQEFPVVKNDIEVIPHGILLPDTTNIEEHKRINENKYSISYPSEAGTIKMEFSQSSFQLEGDEIGKKISVAIPSRIPFIQQTKKENRTNISWVNQSSNEELYSLLLDCQNNTCKGLLKFADNFIAEEFYSNYYPYVLPEITTSHEIATYTSYIHNAVAIKDANPVRAIIIPKDGFGYPTGIPPDLHVKVEPQVEAITINEQDGVSGVIFIDFENSTAGKHTVQLIADDETVLSDQIYFVPNCSIDWIKCLQSPIDSVNFFKFYINGKLRNVLGA